MGVPAHTIPNNLDLDHALRLSQLKIAGFKSFAEPLAVSFPGRLIGVVGPNGCGKSNIVDAVRWVLGESKASALRGDSLQDVIFAGAASRPAAARASVELLLDNSLGKAAGAWSSYAELALKRILERDGNSTYYINNAPVRRRDIADLFLGTGLGPHGYAIIEQGTIARVIEAKPEELRVYLEEAAGVSKYRERRRETEHRLSDTRENLARVDDLLQVLDAQVEKLSAQAEVAEQYRALQADLRGRQLDLLRVRRLDAVAEGERVGRDLAKLSTALEAELARLRAAELRVEHLRGAHFAANDRLHEAQGGLYQANAEVAQVEAELRHVRSVRDRLRSRQQGLGEQADRLRDRGAEIQRDLDLLAGETDAAHQRHEAAAAHARDAQADLVAQEATFAAIEAGRDAVRDELAAAEKAVQAAQLSGQHSERTLIDLAGQHERVEAAIAAVQEPSPASIEQTQSAALAAEAQLGRERERHVELERELRQLDEAMASAQVTARERNVALSQLEARRTALDTLQQASINAGGLPDWLAARGQDAARQLWRDLRIERGWERAVEAALGARLMAYRCAAAQDPTRIIAEHPPAAAVFTLPGEPATETAPAWPGRKTLACLVEADEPALRRLVEVWLGRIYICDNVLAALAEREQLAAGEALVTHDGWLVRPEGFEYGVAKGGEDSLLARKAEIEHLIAAAQRAGAELTAADAAVAELRARAAERRQAWDVLRRDEQESEARLRQAQIDVLKLQQERDQAWQRHAALDAERHALTARRATELERREQATRDQHTTEQTRAAASAAFDAAQTEYGAAAGRLRAIRDAAQAALRAAQDASYRRDIIQQNIQALQRNLNSVEDQRAGVGRELEQIGEELAALTETELAERQQAAVAHQVNSEAEVAGARRAAEDLAAQLRTADEERLSAEQAQQQLRDKVDDLRLRAQSARVSQEQLELQLREAGAEDVASEPERPGRPNVVQAEINRLTQEIAQLGAVNLAALEELTAARERQGFLRAQATDLSAALATLEDAIRRIDRETRGMLRDTFEAVNRNLGELFPRLFGGGVAKLVLTGEEILDAGIEVIAQPPGKKTSTIHLLSGGEKALTAIALVFAMFRLNPAPFCMLDEVDAPLDDANTERFCALVKSMASETQFVFVSHNKITMSLAEQLIGVTMQESGVSRIVAVDVEAALEMARAEAA